MIITCKQSKYSFLSSFYKHSRIYPCKNSSLRVAHIGILEAILTSGGRLLRGGSSGGGRRRGRSLGRPVGAVPQQPQQQRQLLAAHAPREPRRAHVQEQGTRAPRVRRYQTRHHPRESTVCRNM